MAPDARAWSSYVPWNSGWESLVTCTVRKWNDLEYLFKPLVITGIGHYVFVIVVVEEWKTKTQITLPLMSVCMAVHVLSVCIVLCFGGTEGTMSLILFLFQMMKEPDLLRHLIDLLTSCACGHSFTLSCTHWHTLGVFMRIVECNGSLLQYWGGYFVYTSAPPVAIWLTLLPC